MLGRNFIFVGVLFGAAVIPYAANSTDKIKQWFSGGPTDPNKVTDSKDPFAAGWKNNPTDNRSPAQSAGLPRPEGPPVADLAEVIRFDVPPTWVFQRWPQVSRVSTADDATWQGYRVPLVTGIRPDDLAGSLTYYFTQKQFVRRIAFQGTTNDPRRLIALLAQKYDFEQQPAAQPGELLYQVVWKGKPVSELLCRPAPNGAQLQYVVSLEINNFAAK